ncbi:MAG TPA: hypothetical protein VM187_12010 [Niastella sp.]|nr:hypothetical protein [Niastella sp.]
MAKVKATWIELNPAMFPVDVQSKYVASQEARKALTESKAYKAAQDADKATIAAIRAFGDRIAAPDESGSVVKVLQTGHELAVSLKWNKLTVASVPKGRGVKSNAVLA